MTLPFTKLTGLLCIFCILAIPHLQAQGQNPFQSKMKTNTATVQTKTLHAKVVKGQAQKNNARISPGIKPFIPAFSLQSNITPKGLEIKKSAVTGLPVFIKGTIPDSKNARLDMQGASYSYLEAVKEVIQIRNPSAEFETATAFTDQLNQSHIRMKQIYKGLEVYGGEVVLHSQNGVINALNGRYYPTPELSSVTPKISNERAIQIVIGDISGLTTYKAFSTHEQRILDYTAPEAKLVVYHTQQDIQAEKLVWHISIRPNFMELWEYFVDASSGKIIHKFNHTCALDGPKTATAKDLNGINRNIHTYQSGANYFIMDASRPMFKVAASKFPDAPVGIIWTLDAKNTFGKDLTANHITTTTNVWNHPSAVSAHHNGSLAYEYFKNTHSRNSIDGKGGSIISVVNVADDDGKGMDNAYWNGKAMFYGNGNIGFKPLAGALDVAGHELTHGVISNSANLEYQGQSGAINESMADVFGAMIDPEDWKMGEDVVKTTVFKSGALRDLSDPHNGGTTRADRGYQPKFMSELYVGTDDNGGVHINSGIPNYAFYLFATSVTNAKAEKIYYRALTTYLTANSEFTDLRIAVIQAATDLHSANSAEVTAAKNAFDTVGIFENVPNDPTNDLPTNPGQDFILLHDASADNSDPNSIYVASPAGNDLKARSTTEAKRKPSITDDGEFAYFVTTDSQIKYVTLTGTQQEDFVHEQEIWDNVAISKDGSKLAAITTDIDTSIYVYEFASETWTRFYLYNPTYSGVKAGGVLYADAIEWDNTGEYLLYDAYNIIAKSTGDSIDYWDVNVIRVWDKANNKPGDGTVKKIFPSLPEGVSIGNPSYSKNSPHIAAFDHISQTDGTYKIIGANLETGKMEVIADNNTLGYPTYSKADDKLAYTALNAAEDTIVNVIGLEASKIKSNGAAATTIIREGKWAVWYTMGERVLLSAEKDFLSFKFQGLTPAVTATISGTNITATVPVTTDLTKLVATFSSSDLSEVKVGTTSQVSGVTINNFTSQVIYTVTAQDGTTKNYTVNINKDATTGIGDENDISEKVALYPNPNNGHFILRLKQLDIAPVQLEIFNATGKSVYQHTFSAQQSAQDINVEVGNIPSGLYYLQVSVGEKTAYKKLMIQ